AGTAPAEIKLDLRVGPIPVTFSERDGATFGEMRQRDPEFGAVHAREELARACGMALADIADDVPIQTISTGMAFGMVPLRTRAALTDLRFNSAQAAPYLERTGTKFLYFVTRDISGFEGEAAKARLHA